ncbi:helix-turn-helix transcriptional regulator [Myceligenerans pegani]|uniref:Helix-turn-helix transcriptional regulator n=1 Tax=Myceligenerans pegani TaxID=2776917 RepID=A0ABR9N5J0_9MICO|nr:helix-turn-helix transcriptional regulator [Myceligenerans sp. TRM 65318]MBE1878394.1 helix-turn-helix transcriptional regulator [Myceligenerans sp. TRM 65318]MBE3020665.1 helix-turn-helix transcriptional regulator [Myceligenerans sp. TRM 65318]
MAIDVREPMGAAATHRAVRVLGYMIGHDPVREDVVARGLGLSVEEVRETLVALERDRLVERAAGGVVGGGARGGRWTALPPRAVLTALLARRRTDPAAREERVDVLDGTGREPADEGAFVEAGEGDLIDVVAGEEPVSSTLRGFRVTAARELLYLVTPSFPPVAALPGGGGDVAVATRAVHETPAVAATGPGYVPGVPGALDVSYTPGTPRTPGLRLAPGETGVRLAPEVPVGLMVVDRSIAVLPASRGPADGSDGVLVVYAPAVVEALVAMFERVWSEAVPSAGRVPAPSRPAPQTGERRRRVLAMAAAGLTDAAIGRALGISPGTVEDEFAALAGELGVRTRFQAGVLAAKRGLI